MNDTPEKRNIHQPQTSTPPSGDSSQPATTQPGTGNSQPGPAVRRRRNAMPPRMAPPPPLELPPGVTANKSTSQPPPARRPLPPRTRRNALGPGAARPGAAKASTAQSSDQLSQLPPPPQKPAPKPGDQSSQLPPPPQKPAPKPGDQSSAIPPSPQTPAPKPGDQSSSSSSSSSSGAGTQPAAPQDRETQIRTNYIDKHKQEKDEEFKELFGDPNAASQGGGTPSAGGNGTPSTGGNGTPPAAASAPAAPNRVDTNSDEFTGDKKDFVERLAGNDYVDLGVNIATDSMGAVGTASDLTGAYNERSMNAFAKREGIEDLSKMSDEDRAKMTDSEKGLNDRAEGMDTASGWIGLGSSVLDTGWNAVGLYANSRNVHRVNKGHNAQKKRQARMALSSSVFNTAGSLTNLGGSIAGLAGANQLSTDITGAVSSGLGTIGSGIDLSNSIADKVSNHGIASAAQGFMDDTEYSLVGAQNRLDNARKIVSGERGTGDKKKDLTDDQKDMLKKARHDRNEAKARKLSMMYAQKNAKRKSAAANIDIAKNSFGFLGNLSSLGGGIAMSILGGLNKTMGRAWTGLGTSLGAMAGKYIGTAIGMIGGKVREKKDNAEKMKDINQYLTEKAAKIQAEGRQPQVSEKEAKKIALARLGVEFDGSTAETKLEGDTTIGEDMLKEGFNKLMIKRANNIWNSDKKKEMLAAMKLEEGATLKEIAEALGAEFE